jgi:hypothetical protein
MPRNRSSEISISPRTPVRRSIDGMRALAELRSSQCFSEQYETAAHNLSCQGAEGHRWSALAHNVLRGSWCPSCARRVRASLEEMHRIASSRRGGGLSESYLNGRTLLQASEAAPAFPANLPAAGTGFNGDVRRATLPVYFPALCPSNARALTFASVDVSVAFASFSGREKYPKMGDVLCNSRRSKGEIYSSFDHLFKSCFASRREP